MESNRGSDTGVAALGLRGVMVSARVAAQFWMPCLDAQDDL